MLKCKCKIAEKSPKWHILPVFHHMVTKVLGCHGNRISEWLVYVLHVYLRGISCINNELPVCFEISYELVKVQILQKMLKIAIFTSHDHLKCMISNVPGYHGNELS